jgi:hypothetical protein
MTKVNIERAVEPPTPAPVVKLGDFYQNRFGEPIMIIKAGDRFYGVAMESGMNTVGKEGADSPEGVIDLAKRRGAFGRMLKQVDITYK